MPRVYKREGSPFYYLEYHDGERLVRESSGTQDRPEAERLLAERVAAAARRRPGSPLIWETAVERFFDQKPMKPKTRTGYRSSLRAVDPYLRGRRLDEITPGTLRELIAGRRAQPGRRAGQLGDTAIRRDLAFISSVFTFMTEYDDGPERNPVRDLSKRNLGREVRRDRFLSAHEFQVLLACCTTPQQRDIPTLAVETGLRHGELVGLRWRHNVDLARREIVLHVGETKSGQGRVVPLSDAAVRILERTVPHGATDRVFWHDDGRPFKDFHNWWKGVQARAHPLGVTNVRFHDLLRTFASWWLQRGGDWEILRQLLGHTQKEMTDIYGRWRTEDLHAGLARVQRAAAAEEEKLKESGPHSPTHRSV